MDIYMNRTLDKKLYFIIITILLPIAIVKIFYSIVGFYLQKDDLKSKEQNEYMSYYNLFLANKFFTKPDIKNQNIPIEAEKLDDLKLKATYISGNSSFIIVEDEHGTDFVYINESFKGYKLTHIFDLKAVFSKNGETYEIVIDEIKEQDRDYFINEIEGGEIPMHKDVDMVILEEPIGVTKQELDSYMRNPNKIWRNIRVQEIRKDGQIDGFRVNYVKKSSFFDKSGLKSGDIIKAIDGKEIKSLADVMKYYNNIRNLDSLSLTILRGKEEIELSFYIAN